MLTSTNPQPNTNAAQTNAQDAGPPGPCSGPLPPACGGHSPTRPSASASSCDQPADEVSAGLASVGARGMSATYSPEDNKLRLSSVSRLDAETYQRVRAAGFIWAPRQKLFVAPMWTPEREDLVIELCGEIGDEDSTLVDRAEERAERFEGYQENRLADAHAAKRAVDAIAQNIPLGQPILVGHHSERRARKDAERIENGMRRAIKMWDTAKYWERRAAGAIRHARYKELPDVRHRRIKGLERDRRRQEKAVAKAETFLELWRHPNLTRERATAIADYEYLLPVVLDGVEMTWSLRQGLTDGRLTVEQAVGIASAAHESAIERARRWITHYTNRIAYERAMLGDAGGLPAERFDLQVGGQVLVGRDWGTILRVNRKDGRAVSVRATCWFAPRGTVYGVEAIQDYRAPTAERAKAAATATKLAPLCNYPGPDFREMTQSEWNRLPKDYKSVRIAPATEQAGAHRYRQAFTNDGHFGVARVFITDAKRIDPPAPTQVGAAEVSADVSAVPALRTARKATAPSPESLTFEAMRSQLRTGVKAVSAPQLFPTPSPLAQRMVELAELRAGMRVLEPSAGTGALVDAILASGARTNLTVVEINHELAANLRSRVSDVRGLDFLSCGAELGQFDRIIMNPPFENGQDIKHIEHARTFLKPGGKLVAICAGGPRQATHLQPLVQSCGELWEELAPGTFPGTSVRAVLLTLKS